MRLSELIERAASDQRLQPSDVESAAAEMGLSIGDLLDAFARSVATDYLQGRISFNFADVAMNWDVYIAFDDGEYIHEGMPEEEQGEVLTRALLSRIDSIGAA